MTITAKETGYIWPPRAEGATKRGDYAIFESRGWIAQYKYSDTRSLIKCKADGRIELWNRHAERAKYHTPLQLQEQLEQIHNTLGPGYHLLDGGLLDQKHKAIKNTIAICDTPVKDSEHLIGTTYKHRYNIIQTLTTNEPYTFNNHHLGQQITQDILTPINYGPNDWEQCWNIIDTINTPYLAEGCGPLIEGLVFKDPNGELEFGFSEKNNASWMCRSRVETGRHRF